MTQRDNDPGRLRAELTERRECLVGAKQTCEMVRDTLANADSLDIVRLSLGIPVEQRIDLIQRAIDSTDAALGDAP